MSFTNPFSTKTARVSKILASEINAAGVSIERALDGTGGGTYTPSAPLIIGGSGMQIPSGATWTVLSGGTFSVANGATLSGGATSTVTLPGANTLSGTNVFSGTNSFTGTTEFSNSIVRTGANATYRERVTTIAGTSDATINTDYDAYRCNDPNANRTYTISNPSADGLTIRLNRVVIASGFTITIRRADTTTIGVFPNTGASWVVYKSLGGVWTAFEWGGDVTSLA